MMPAKVTGGSFYSFDSWQGYPQEREELLAYIKARGIDDVVFITGDIHLFLAGDVRTQMGDGESVAVEFVGGSVTSTNFGEMDIDAGGGVIIPGNDAAPATDPGIIQRAAQHQPVGRSGRLRPSRLRAGRGLAQRVRVHAEAARDDQAPLTRAAHDGFRYRLERGQKSIKGVNGPNA
jgi:alkaline phosphatase D